MSDLPVDSPSGPRTRLPAAPIGTACGVASVALYVAAVDPSAGAVLPRCPFQTLTGCWCPGCGMTRATHTLLHGDVIGALRYNALFPLVLTLITVAWLDWYARSAGRRPVLSARLPQWVPLTGIAVAVAFAVVRNLPGFDNLRG